MDFAQQIEAELDYWEAHGEVSPSLIQMLSSFRDYLADDFMFLIFKAVEHRHEPAKLKQLLEEDAKEHHELYSDLYLEYTTLQNALLRRFCKDE